MDKNYFSSKNLTLGYGNSIVINNLPLSLDFDKNYEIIGRNGAGKSTLLDFISNNFQGNKFDSAVNLKDLRILQLSSEFTLISNLTLRENCLYFTKNKISLNDINKVLTDYDIYHFENDVIQKFSSGMIKRSELAVAELISPDVLCIDEPLNYLDGLGVELLKKLIIKRNENKQSTILCSQEPLNLFTETWETIDLNA
ncbi:ATP-binding cassette domain-containing protein [Acidimicrobiaceae bacterium]|nr:ATP-binding cassette domain-containing protein [Acidimicrobiaceae bacterium]NND23764.1 ATP-binding cassette domain-containing protein [Acidimicrobiia bacterium]